MKKMMTYLTLALTVVISSVMPTAQAEQTIETEQYIIHYNAFNSTFIAPEVAQANNIVRSKYSAMLNIAVIKKDANAEPKPVKALINGEVTNRLQQLQALRFSLINEGDAVYYLTSFTFADADTLDFTITVQPDPNKEAITLRFDQQFFTD